MYGNKDYGGELALSVFIVTILGFPLGLIGLNIYNASQERIKKMELERTPVIISSVVKSDVTATQTRIDGDELDDLVLKFDDKTVILLAEQGKQCITYRLIRSDDIYRIR